MYKFEVTQFAKDCVKVGDEYRRVEAEIKYEVKNYDDLSNLLLSLIDFGTDRVKFEVKKEEVSE